MSTIYSVGVETSQTQEGPLSPLSRSSRLAARNGTEGQGYVHPSHRAPTSQVLITSPLPVPRYPPPPPFVSISPQTDSR